MGVSLVKYWVPFCKVTTVGDAQPASARNATATMGRPRNLMFITITSQSKGHGATDSTAPSH
ncbi:hypothetical protein D3C81_1958200 [compost metagenome]